MRLIDALPSNGETSYGCSHETEFRELQAVAVAGEKRIGAVLDEQLLALPPVQLGRIPR